MTCNCRADENFSSLLGLEIFGRLLSIFHTDVVEGMSSHLYHNKNDFNVINNWQIIIDAYNDIFLMTNVLSSVMIR